MALTAKEIQTIYVAFLGRAADTSGFEYWQNGDRDQAIAAISGSQESQNIYKDLSIPGSIQKIYYFLLGRDTDEDGLFYWASQVNADKSNLSEVAMNIAIAAQNNPNLNPVTGKLDSVAIANKILAAEQLTNALLSNPKAAANYIADPVAVGQAFIKSIDADSVPTSISAAVTKTVSQIEQGGISDGGTEFTFINDLGQGTLNNITNLGFDPAGKFLVEGNDTIKVESFDSLNSVVIKDPSVKDLDIMTIALSDKTTNVFRATMENVETLHVDVSGGELENPVKFAYFDNTTGNQVNKITGLKTLEFAGSTNGEIKVHNTVDTNGNVNGGSYLPDGVTKIDASGLTGGSVNFDANNTSVTTLIGGANGDTLTIGTNGGTLTGGQGADTFVVGAALNKLVTITDIASKDKINFGRTFATTDDAKELIITDASDETTFVAALQKEANTHEANGLYYATFNGDTYLIANGAVTGGKVNGKADIDISTKANLTNVKGAASAVIGGSASADLTKATVTGSVKFTSGSATYSATTGLKVSGLTYPAPSASAGTLSFQANTKTVTITSATVPAVAQKLTNVTVDGTNYMLNQFDDVNITVGGKSLVELELSKFQFSSNDGTMASNASTFSGKAGTAELTGKLTNVDFVGTLLGDTEALKDDIIVKLSGTHNIPTEADVSVGVDGISWLNFV